VTRTVGTFGASESTVVTSTPSTLVLIGDAEPNGQNILPMEPRTLLRFSSVGRFGGDAFGKDSSDGTSVVFTLELSRAEAAGAAGVSRGTGTISGSESTTASVFCFEDLTAGVGGGR